MYLGKLRCSPSPLSGRPGLHLPLLAELQGASAVGITVLAGKQFVVGSSQENAGSLKDTDVLFAFQPSNDFATKPLITKM